MNKRPSFFPNTDARSQTNATRCCKPASSPRLSSVLVLLSILLLFSDRIPACGPRNNGPLAPQSSIIFVYCDSLGNKWKLPPLLHSPPPFGGASR